MDGIKTRTIRAPDTETKGTGDLETLARMFTFVPVQNRSKQTPMALSTAKES